MMLALTTMLFSCSNNTKTDNPLMIDFNGPLQLVPFDKIKVSHYKPAFESAINEAREDLKAITSSTEEPTFSNTIEALEYSNYRVQRLSAVFFNLNSAETSKEIQQIAQEISPLLTAFSNDITLDETLFARVKSVYEHRDNAGLDKEL